VLIYHGLKLVGRDVCLIHNHMIVNWSSCTLNSGMRVQVCWC
jgi:hypothetical protein